MAELGASPVADYSKIGQQGFQISQQASMRAEKQQNELKAAYAHMGSRGVMGKLVMVN